MLGPHAGHGGMAVAAPPVRPGDLRRVIVTARRLKIAPPVLLSPPEHPGGAWAITSAAADRPLRADARVDGASGRLIGRIDFDDRHWIDRTVGYGIAAHEGALFGVANQILGTLTAKCRWSSVWLSRG